MRKQIRADGQDRTSAQFARPGVLYTSQCPYAKLENIYIRACMCISEIGDVRIKTNVLLSTVGYKMTTNISTAAIVPSKSDGKRDYFGTASGYIAGFLDHGQQIRESIRLTEFPVSTVRTK